MRHRTRLLGLLGSVALATVLAGCAPSIPREQVPDGWVLDVHQPGAWWTEPLIPRAVVVARCAPRPGWISDPNLAVVPGLPPGTMVEFSSFVDDFHCLVGWSEPASDIAFAAGDMASEDGLRRICSSSGLPMDTSWRFVGSRARQRAWDPDVTEHTAVAVFIDEERTVVSCLVNFMGEASGGASVELSVGAATVPEAGGICPVVARDFVREDDDTVGEYQFRGAGPVRDDAGHLLLGAKTVELRLAGDTRTTSHPVVEGVAIVTALVDPDAAIPLDWDHLPPVEGRILDAGGAVLATCHT